MASKTAERRTPTTSTTLPARFEQIAVSKLEVDPTLDAQRIFSDPWANKLESIYEPEYLLPALVSQRMENGKARFYLLDGQHSTEVTVRVMGPDFERGCVVFENLTRMQEAKIFLSANRDRKPVKPYDNFRVACTAEDALALRVKREVESLGGDLQIAASTSTNRIGAVQALMFIGGKREGLIPKVLTAAEGAWGRDLATWDNMMLRAIAMVVDNNWELVDIKRLSKTLGRAVPSRWKSLAIGLTSSGGGSNSRSTPLANRIIMEYNEARGLKPEMQLRLMNTKNI